MDSQALSAMRWCLVKNWTTAVGMECANEVVYVYATPDGRYESIRQPLPLAHSPCFIFTFTHLHAIFTFTACKKCKYVWVCACASDWCCFDWCCFYYFIWNCLEALLGALFTRWCACLRVCASWRARKVEAVSMGSFSCQVSSCHTQSISSHRGLRAFNQIVPVCAPVFLSFFLPLSCRLTLFLPLAPSDEENALLWHHLCVCVCVC